MKVQKIDIAGRSLDEIFAVLPAEKIACCNWAKEYPYSPEVEFKIFHTGEKLYLRYYVTESYTAARVAKDNGEVWTDSCCECFLSLDGEAYYNIETTCITRMLIGYRAKGQDVIHAGDDILSQVERHSTLGVEPFDERIGKNSWELTLGLPTTIFHQHDIESWSGLKLKGNLYKCGDNLSKPHFLSWQPISLPQPCFHCPEFFVELEMES